VRRRWCSPRPTAIARALMRISAAVAALLVLARPAHAQIAPDLHWSSFATAHFRVHFSEGLEPVARRAAGSAERAWTRLSAELADPRGPIELVIADNVDYSNGYATLFPSNRIVVYARPAVEGSALKFMDDWFDLVITHELAHIFHLDRTKGWWRVGQYVFGRNPFLFPGLYTPSWMDEGIAVYFESRLTGSGRIPGAEHTMIVRSPLLDGSAPRVNAWSASTTRFPLGQVPYAFGSLLMQQLSTVRGPTAMRTFVERSAERAIPYLLNANARDAFGIDLDSAFSLLADSLTRSGRANPVSPGRTAAPKDLTGRGWFAERLRWVGNDRLIYARDDGRTLTSLAEVTLADGTARSVAIRNSFGTTSPVPDSSRVFAQQEYVDPYTVRSDLYRERDGVTTRLTRGQRLVQPDARCVDRSSAATPSPGTRGPRSKDCDARVVAVQLTAASSRIVTVEGGVISPVTGSALDTIWSEPRWSHDGTRIVAVRRTRGAQSAVVVLDARGSILAVLGESHGVTMAPSWSPRDDAVFFTSDRNGRAALYRTVVATGEVERVAEAAHGLFESEVSPDGRTIATLQYRSDGYHVATLPADGPRERVDSASVFPTSRGDSVITIGASVAPATAYSPWRSLLPTYWLPATTTSDLQRTSYGFITSGTDVIGRHRYAATVVTDPGRGESEWDLSYAYAGLGNPVFGGYSSAAWDHFAVADSLKRPLGTLDRRKRFGGLSLTMQRVRYRSNAYVSVGAEIEFRDFATTPAALLSKLGATYARSYQYPTLSVTAGFGNARFTALGISPEDGIQAAATFRQRWRSDAVSATNSSSIVGYLHGFKAFDLGGPAHAVFAARAAFGWADDRAASEFQAGGASGGVLSVIPGITVGEGRRTFFVRGFPASAQYGTQALGASLELRVPLAQPARGWWMLPLFLQKVNASLFTDGATAWCPAGTANVTVCNSKASPRDWMQSVGAELQFDTAMQYDVPYRFRIGAALPVSGSRYARSRGVNGYFSIGVPF
jgi:hypothetical protein